MWLRLPRAGGAHRRAAGPLVRLRLDPIRPRRALHGRCSCPRACRCAFRGTCASGGTFSGGTYHSAIHILGRLRQGAERRPRAPAGSSRVPRAARCAASPGARTTTPTQAAGWCRFRRSIRRPCCARRGRSIAYGPDFSYEPLPGPQTRGGGRRVRARRRGADRARAAAADARPAAQVQGPGRGADARAARASRGSGSG